MASPEKKPFSPVWFVIDMIAVAAFFLYFWLSVLPCHVPSSDPAMVRFWSAAGAACLSGVFWLALQMVKTVARFQRASRR